jgi:(p)ppGpp synthase/HD superfamily hydrolase
MSILLSKAISLTASKFEGKCDKGGQPYILHCLHVMYQMPENDPELRMIAVMHDLIEDTDTTVCDLIEMGFPQRVLEGVCILTHLHDVTYDDYIKRISLSEDATKVKLADLRHNSDITRMKGLRKKDFDRLEKYQRAYIYLKG